jgi:transcriptional regulator with XRE-family HTH domain
MNRLSRDFIAAARASGLTLAEMARCAKVSTATAGNWLNGRPVANTHGVRALARRLHVPFASAFAEPAEPIREVLRVPPELLEEFQNVCAERGLAPQVGVRVALAAWIRTHAAPRIRPTIGPVEFK